MGFRVSGLGFKASGFWVEGFGGLGSRVWGLGFPMFWGLGLQGFRV